MNKKIWQCNSLMPADHEAHAEVIRIHGEQNTWFNIRRNFTYSYSEIMRQLRLTFTLLVRQMHRALTSEPEN